MNDDQIKHMVNRFLQWQLPKNFAPDAGISYTPPNYTGAARDNHRITGTNLFDATQADAMVRFMVDGMASPADDAIMEEARVESSKFYATECTIEKASFMDGAKFALNSVRRPTAPADVVEALREAIADIQWMSAASDFGPEGVAHEGWIKVRDKLKRYDTALALAGAKKESGT
jgi:hypothetical protein